MNSDFVRRADWAEVIRRFEAFFEGLGDVTVNDDVAAFDGPPTVGTGLALQRDGTSTSFMPLHGLEARWERARFDAAAGEVILEGTGMTYTYRVPPALRRRNE